VAIKDACPHRKMAVQILVNGLVIGLLYALVALGFSLVYSGTRIFNLAHGAIYTSAAYIFLVATRVGSNPSGPLAVIAPILITFLSLCILAAAVEFCVYRPLYRKKAPPLIAFISSIGLYIVAVNLLAWIFGNETRILRSGIESPILLGPVVITKIQIIQLLISTLLLSATFLILKKTSLGRSIRALSDNPTLIGILGINPLRLRLAIFLLASVLAAAASLLRAVEVGIDPNAGFQVVLIASVAMIIGGVGSFSGTVWSALFLGVIQNIFVWFLSAQWQYAASFFVLVLILLVRREGVFAARMRLEEA